MSLAASVSDNNTRVCSTLSFNRAWKQLSAMTYVATPDVHVMMLSPRFTAPPGLFVRRYMPQQSRSTPPRRAHRGFQNSQLRLGSTGDRCTTTRQGLGHLYRVRISVMAILADTSLALTDS